MNESSRAPKHDRILLGSRAIVDLEVKIGSHPSTSVKIQYHFDRTLWASDGGPRKFVDMMNLAAITL
jgi:hypothetical protein